MRLSGLCNYKKCSSGLKKAKEKTKSGIGRISVGLRSYEVKRLGRLEDWDQAEEDLLLSLMEESSLLGLARP